MLAAASRFAWLCRFGLSCAYTHKLVSLSWVGFAILLRPNKNESNHKSIIFQPPFWSTCSRFVLAFFAEQCHVVARCVNPKLCRLPRVSSTSRADLACVLTVCFLCDCLSSYCFQMTVKRRNHGRNKKNKGKARRVNCASSGKLVPKDKAVKRFVVRYVSRNHHIPLALRLRINVHKVLVVGF